MSNQEQQLRLQHQISQMNQMNQIRQQQRPIINNQLMYNNPNQQYSNSNMVPMQWFNQQQQQPNSSMMQRHLLLLQQQQQQQQQQVQVPPAVQAQQRQPQQPRIVQRIPTQMHIRPSPVTQPLFSNSPNQYERVFQQSQFHGLVDPTMQWSTGETLQKYTTHKDIKPEIVIQQPTSTQGTTKRLYSMLQETGIEFEISERTEDSILMFADYFINQVTFKASRLAKHSGHSFIKVKDLVKELEMNWNIRVPGYEVDASASRKIDNALHLQKMSMVSKYKRDIEASRVSKKMHVIWQAKELQSSVELKEEEGNNELNVDDEVLVQEPVIFDDLEKGESADSELKMEDSSLDETPVGLTPAVESSVGTPSIM